MEDIKIVIEFMLVLLISALTGGMIILIGAVVNKLIGKLTKQK